MTPSCALPHPVMICRPWNANRLRNVVSSETPDPLICRSTVKWCRSLDLPHPFICRNLWFLDWLEMPILTEKRCILWNTPSSETPHPVKFRTTEKHPILRNADRPRNILPFKTPLHLKCWTTEITKGRSSELCSVMFLWTHLSVHAWSWRFSVAKSWGMHSW